MKYADIQKLRDAGLITDEQRQKIVEHFQLKEDGGGKFLAIVSIVGAVLIAAGITLLIAAHWNDIPRGVKIAAGLLLMLGFHAGGWWLREGGGDATSPVSSATGVSQLPGLPLFDPDFNNFQRFGFCKWRICKGCPARRRSKGLVVQTYPVPIGGVLCIIMSHHVSQTFISS